MITLVVCSRPTQILEEVVCDYEVRKAGSNERPTQIAQPNYAISVDVDVRAALTAEVLATQALDTQFVQCQTYSIGGIVPDDRLTLFPAREQYDALVASIG